MEAISYTEIDFEKVAAELQQNYHAIYNGIAQCSDTANILTRSKSKWAEYSIRDLCLHPVNFDYIETTSNRLLGKHGVLFYEILKLIYVFESYIPFDSRLKIFTYNESVEIQIVHHFTIMVNNPYEEIYENGFDFKHRVFKSSTINKVKNALTGLNFNAFYRADITLK